MNPDILLRSALALGIIAAAVALYWLYNHWMLGRAASQFGKLLPGRHDGPVLVYFTTPSCAPCKTVQKPAIEQVRNMLAKGLEVVEIDAAEQPDVARRWGVVSVPTTFVLDAHGQAHYVNNGVARAEKLFKQLQGI
jgi:thioredoxin-like negative regulator of GroEL